MKPTVQQEPEITEPVDLCLPNGRLNPEAIGWSRRPLHRCNLKGRWFSKKRWNYWAVTSESHLFALSISNRDYVGRVFVHIGDFSKGKLIDKTVVTPFGRGMTLPDTVHETASFHHPELSIVLEQLVAQVKITVSARDFEGEQLDAEFRIHYPESHETLSVVIPWSGRMFQYTSKHNCLPASGTVRLGSSEIHFDGPQTFGCHDYGRGIWPRRSTWNWGSASALSDGRLIGLNLGGKWTDGTGMTENGVCIEGRVTKISEDLSWVYDKSDFMKPWRIEAAQTGQVALTFTPFLERAAAGRLGPTRAEVHQMFGRYEGMVMAVNGEQIDIRDMLGWAEELVALW